MGHALELTDAQYEILRQVAARDQETPEQLLARMVDALATTQGTIYYTDEELLRALGADDEELTELAALETNPNIFEMTWEGEDGRATFDYGPAQRPGEKHVRWRRIGGHEILDQP